MRGFARAPSLPTPAKYEQAASWVIVCPCSSWPVQWVWSVRSELWKIITNYATCFLTENGETMREAFGPSLTRSPSPLQPTSSNSAACFLRNQLPPKGYWIFLKCRFLSELIRQQPACKDNASHWGFLGLSLFGFLSKYSTHAESCLETLGLVVPPLLSLCI